MRIQLPLVAVALAAASCTTPAPPAVTSTVTVSAQPTTTPTTPTTQSGSFSQDGDYAVGIAPAGGLAVAIPPGRYRVEFNPNADDSVGVAARCSDYQCGAQTENWIDFVPLSLGDLPSVIVIEPTDVAVYLRSVTLTPAG